MRSGSGRDDPAGSRWKHAAVAAMALLALLSLGGIAAAAAQTTTTSSTSSYTVGVASSASLGTYLVNGTGFTLYYFAADTVGTSTTPPTSACTTSCLSVWPAFYAANIVVQPGSGLNASAFTTFTNQAGASQTAYMGHPLYYYVADTAAGDTTGQALDINGGYWYVVPLSFTSSTSTTSTSTTSTVSSPTTTTTSSSTSSSSIALSPAAVLSLTVAASMALVAVALGSKLRGSSRGTRLSGPSFAAQMVTE